jgi:hypothetical protein
MIRYYLIPDGEPTDIRRLLPSVINPQNLTDAELLERGIARVEVTQPALQWWQQRGERVIDDTGTPHVMTWSVVDRPLEQVKALAWERIKETRAEKRGEGTLHNGIPVQVRDEDITNLLALHAAATTALMNQQSPNLPFTDSENATHWLTPAEMLALTMAAFGHGSMVHVTSQNLRDAINAAETVAAVVAVEWPE